MIQPIVGFIEEFQKKLLGKRQERFEEQQKVYKQNIQENFKQLIVDKAIKFYQKQKSKIKKDIESMLWDQQKMQSDKLKDL